MIVSIVFLNSYCGMPKIFVTFLSQLLYKIRVIEVALATKIIAIKLLK